MKQKNNNQVMAFHFVKPRYRVKIKPGKLILSLILMTTSLVTLAEQIEVIPEDCGPVGYRKVGVVFMLSPRGSGKSYYTEGTADEVCPKIMKSKSLIGYELDFCENYQPLTPGLCPLTKVFIIEKYNFKE